MVEQLKPYQNGGGDDLDRVLPVDFGDRDWLYVNNATGEFWGRLEGSDRFYVFDPSGLDIETTVEPSPEVADHDNNVTAKLGRLATKRLQHAKYN
jgi:hypothetical protein